MKKAFALFCVACALPFSGAFAQGGEKMPLPKAADGKTMDGNYVLTLVASGKEQPAQELSVVVATPVFNTSSAEPAITFTGSCAPLEDGTYLITYALGRSVAVPAGPNNFNYRSAATQAAVRLRLGEPVQIIRDGSQVFTLKLDRYKAEAR